MAAAQIGLMQGKQIIRAFNSNVCFMYGAYHSCGGLPLAVSSRTTFVVAEIAVERA